MTAVAKIAPPSNFTRPFWRKTASISSKELFFWSSLTFGEKTLQFSPKTFFLVYIQFRRRNYVIFTKILLHAKCYNLSSLLIRTIVACRILKKNLNGNNCDTLAEYTMVQKSQTFHTLRRLFVCRGKRQLKLTLNV